LDEVNAWDERYDTAGRERLTASTSPSALRSFALFIGLNAPASNQIKDLLTDGATIVIAPSRESAQAWLSLMAMEASHNDVVRLDELVIDLTAHEASWRGESIFLTEHELQLLALLAREAGRAWSFQALLKTVWGQAYQNDQDILRSAIKRLRRKLHASAVAISIEAVRGVGFRLRCKR
jgi:DNA-binding response OmpR family regulator